jgi:ankyrin repeat protein
MGVCYNSENRNILLCIYLRWGSEAIVKFILRKKGCEARQILDSGDRLGRTPLHYAASQKTGLTYITNLLKAGANINAQARSSYLPLPTHVLFYSAI